MAALRAAAAAFKSRRAIKPVLGTRRRAEFGFYFGLGRPFILLQYGETGSVEASGLYLAVSADGSPYFGVLG